MTGGMCVGQVKVETESEMMFWEDQPLHALLPVLQRVVGDDRLTIVLLLSCYVSYKAACTEVLVSD